MSYVYLHIKSTDGTPFYIGKGTRKGRAGSTRNRSDWWRKTVSKHGFDVLILENYLTEEESFEREKYWIKRIGRRDLGLGTLVNHTDGGEGVSGATWKMSEETKRKISENNGRGNLGRDFPDSTKKLMSEAKKKKIIDTKTGIVFNSIQEASDISGVNYSTLSQYLRGIRTNKTNLKFYE